MSPRGGRSRTSRLLGLKLSVSCVVFLVLFGCASVPPLNPPSFDPARSANAIASRRLDMPEVRRVLAAAGLPAAETSTGPWDLDALTVVAWRFRGEVAGARAASEAANAGVRVAAAKPPISISLTPEVVTSALGGLSPWIVALALGATLETHGKRQLRAERAASDAAFAEADLAATLWAVRAEVRQALIDLTLARRESALADEEARLRGDFSRWLSTQLAMGAVSRPDLATAESDLARATGQAKLAHLEETAARGRIAVALGVGPEAVSDVLFEPPDLDVLPRPFAESRSNELRALATISRIDLRRPLTRYAAAIADLRAAVAARFPDWTLGPGLTYDQGDRKVVLGVGLTLPRAAAAHAEIERATAHVAEAGAALESLQARSLAETAAAIESYAAIHAVLEKVEQAQGERSAAVANAERRRDVGAADRGDVLSAALAELEGRRAVFSVRRAAVEALTRLETGVQSPIWPEPKR